MAYATNLRYVTFKTVLIMEHRIQSYSSATQQVIEGDEASIPPARKQHQLYSTIERRKDVPKSVGIPLGSLPQIKSKKKVTQIIPILADYLKAKKLVAGDRLPPERELTIALGVGRRSLREAMINLEVVGLIEPQQGSGWFVRGFDAAKSTEFLTAVLRNFSGADIGQIIDSRLTIEPTIAQLAAVKIEPERIAFLYENMERMKNASSEAELDVFRRLDTTFHRVLGDACGNGILSMMDSILISIFYEVLGETKYSNYESILIQHKVILDKIMAKDADGAREAMIAHVAEARKYLKEKLHVLGHKITPLD
jgi:DNA-binding FadR family transcriptional regulator